MKQTLIYVFIIGLSLAAHGSRGSHTTEDDTTSGNHQSIRTADASDFLQICRELGLSDADCQEGLNLAVSPYDQWCQKHGISLSMCGTLKALRHASNSKEPQKKKTQTSSVQPADYIPDTYVPDSYGGGGAQ